MVELTALLSREVEQLQVFATF